MTITTEIHPDAVLTSLLEKGGRSHRQRKLAQVQEICRRQHNASRDFSISTIGRLCEAEGIIKGRALYNAQSADYRVLIDAWAAYAGPPAPKPTKQMRVLASHEYLMRIDDPAIRSIMQATIVERDRLKAQINTLKASSNVVIDRRPLGATIEHNGSTVPVLMVSPQLTHSEREALENAIAPAFLEERGWKEGSHGEILTEDGRLVYDVGYARAIRKLLTN